LGLGVFLAILLHKPLDALSITSLMRAGGWGGGARLAANLGFALLCPLGAVLFVWGVGFLDDQAFVVGCALAFSAGVFLCISLGDLLPEVHFHSHDRVKLTLVFLVGIALAYGLRFVEPGFTHALATAH
jgi:zinc and cadmium transporter